MSGLAPPDREEARREAGPGQGGAASMVLGAEHGPAEDEALVDAGLPMAEDDTVVLVVEVRSAGAGCPLPVRRTCTDAPADTRPLMSMVGGSTPAGAGRSGCRSRSRRADKYGLKHLTYQGESK
jgi:hypothetical protein